MVKDRVLKNARQLLDQQRQVYAQNQPTAQLLGGDLSQLEKEYFDQDDVTNMLGDVGDFKDNLLNSLGKKKAKARL